MAEQHGMVAIEGEVEDAPGAVRLHIHHERIGGVQDGNAIGRHDIDDAALHFREVFRRVDFAQPEVIAFADVRHHSDVAAVESEPFAEDSAAGGLENGGVNRRIEQNGPGALRPAAIAAVDPPAVDEDAVGAGHADAQAHPLEDVGDEAAWWWFCR